MEFQLPRITYSESRSLIWSNFPSPQRIFWGRKIGVGGAYFRIFPFYIFRNFFHLRCRLKNPAMFYGHPWEYDPGHPKVLFHWKAMITHYFNLKGMARKTEKLLGIFQFASGYQVIDACQRDGKIPSVSLAKLAL